LERPNFGKGDKSKENKQNTTLPGGDGLPTLIEGVAEKMEQRFWRHMRTKARQKDSGTRKGAGNQEMLVPK